MIAHKKRIVVFDENESYNSIVTAYLKKAQLFNLINSYRDFNLMMANIKIDKPDIILMDIPQDLGLSGIKRVKKEVPYVNVIALSEHQQFEPVASALRAGADGYVIKHLNSSDLINALDKTHSGGVALSPSIARTLVQDFWKPNNNPLSKAEIKVLKLISKAGTYTTIAKDLQISAQTVKTHTRNIYRKLNVHNKSEALAIAQQGRLIN